MLQDRLAGSILGFAIDIVVVEEFVVRIVVLTEEYHGVVVILVGRDILCQYLVAIHIADMFRSLIRK